MHDCFTDFTPRLQQGRLARRIPVNRLRLLQAVPFLAGSLLSIALSSLPAKGAERLYLSYGVLERSVSVSALEDYARTGNLDQDLYVYSQYASDQQLATLRKALTTRASLSPIAVSQFLYTPQGEILLRRLGEVIQPESRDTGFYAIRAALILASADPEGITPLNVFRRFPTRGIRIDLQKSLEIAGDLGNLIDRTNQATAAISRLADQNDTPFPNPTLADLAARGTFGVQKETLRLVDRRRNIVSALGGDRVLPVDVYLPQSRRQALPSSVPVVVISHGLGSDRMTFAYLAEHLASHGFAVAIPEHPGSNAKQLQALIAGTASEVASPREFIDRPSDIKFLLDELTRRARSDARYGRLNLQGVGVLGQSFGGYTVFALAGAPLNFAKLRQDCTPTALANTLNISLALQCRVLALPREDYTLSDPRVRAVFAINPINSGVFGQTGLSQIQVPTFVVGGNADTIAPALPEQIQPFTWLQAPDRYFALIDRGTHFSTLGDSQDEGIPVPPEVIGPSPAIARRYINALSLAFFSTYVAGQANYRPYLSSTYANFLSQPPLKLSLVQMLEEQQLR
ncbi:alpha/beta hydrolase [Myxacorys almedinensis]|uniref:Alpha/beta hydrolase n=1 Tax=Myxacorys almedinensis A TaxID=2690445 RepID=A0A8J7Z3J4_9CYAN|nr:alpha/beta hydrolase [Myxacorys almedinensis]NDJ19089.1 alpha/beta hydrolase [Myxacorys almedinensis A]